MSKIKFVNLHGHSCAGSPFDGLGFPKEHMDFAFSNGAEALALTDHGNMNGFAYQVLHAKQMKKEGKTFKPIYGIEAYYHPSIESWKNQKIELEKSKKKKKSKDTFLIEDEKESKKKSGNPLRHSRHLILLAQNQIGLSNIFKLISESFHGENYYYKPRIDLKQLALNNEGILASSACLGGVYAKDMWAHQEKGIEAVYEAMCNTTEDMLSVFGDRWYGELQWNNVIEQHVLNKLVIRLHKDFGIPLISTADSHYPKPDLWKDRVLYKNLGWLKGEIPQLPSSVDEIGYELYPKNGEQMWDSYKKYSKFCEVEYDDDLVMESLTRTYEIAFSEIDDFIPDNKVRLPDFVIPKGYKNATSALTSLAIEGLKNKQLTGDRKYINRLKHELHVINDRDFSKYFLTMKAISDLAQEDRLTGPGRGSAAGALLSYVLGITSVDPIKYNLQFERFMRRDATDYPDIDFDLSNPMDFKEKLIDKWGENSVVPISNFNTLQPKSLIKDISKFYGIPFQESNEVTSVMEAEAIPKAKEIHGIKAGVYNPTFDELLEFSTTLKNFLMKNPEIETHLRVLRGQVRSQSRHAGGVVIGKDLNFHMPLVKSGGTIQTPWSEGQKVRHLEPMGFIKYDLLGLSTLEVIESAIQLILNTNDFKQVKDFWNTNLNPETSSFNDPEVYKNIFHKGRFAATFQFSEGFAQRACFEAKPNSIIELATLTSILRPGPMGAQVDKKYIEARQNPGSISYLNKEIELVTKETLGFLVFQEQIAELAHKLGKDISLEDGNKLRKILTKNTSGKVGKRKPSEEEKELHTKFVDGCIEKGMHPNAAEAQWENFIYFSAYGFNKSHAVCYSIITYQCAWMLHYYPAEWFASYLSHVDDKKRESAINLAKQFGFKIGKYDINKSNFTWNISDDKTTLIPPLVSIKGIGEKAVVEIVKYRPYETIEDLIFHPEISGRAVGKKVLDSLIRAEALNEFVDERFTGNKHFWSAVAVDRPKTIKKFLGNIEKYQKEGQFSQAERLLNLQSLTGNYPVSMILSNNLLDRLKEVNCSPLGEWDPEDPLGRTESGLAFCWFIPFEKIVKRTKKNKKYWVVKCTDISGSVIELKCWGIQENHKIILHKPYMAGLDYDSKWGFSTRKVWNFKMIG